MAVSVGEVMACVRRYFVLDEYEGAIRTEAGVPVTPAQTPGATWFALQGYGVFEKGQLPEVDLPYGKMWELAPPEAFLRLCREISAWDDLHGGVKGERFGSYSVEHPQSWQEVFSPRLRCWQRMFTEVVL